MENDVGGIGDRIEIFFAVGGSDSSLLDSVENCSSNLLEEGQKRQSTY